MNHDVQHSESVLVVRHELEHLRAEWWWFLILGILLVLSGTVALVYPFVASLAVVVVLGMSLLISGVATIVTSFWAGKWSALLLQLLIGVFYAVLGFIIMDTPIASTVSLTLVVAAMFIVVGIMRSVAALAIRFPQWGWALLSGALTTLVGLAIYKNLPETALWAIGTLVGIQLIFDGWFWIMLSAAIRRLPIRA
ncbi:MAG TPA: HdeD family acid-resistance protein [Pirellulaceae bacterium]|nr:HdeD family acid-resistance protein [Pirellulaceae bacterium]